MAVVQSVSPYSSVCKHFVYNSDPFEGIRFETEYQIFMADGQNVSSTYLLDILFDR